MLQPRPAHAATARAALPARRAARLGLGLALLAGCGPQDAAAPDSAAGPAAPARAPAAEAGTGAGAGAPLALQPGDLLVADLDAGPAQADGERLGLLFLARPAAGAAHGAGGSPPAGGAAAPATYELTELARDERWREPADALPLPDGSVLVLEQQWSPHGDAARGAIFRVSRRGVPPELWWSDPRTRQLVAMARGADGTLWVSDKDGDPTGLGVNTGCVFAIAPGADGAAGTTRVAAAGPALVAPGALHVSSDGHVLLMDADANPRHVVLPDGRAATPGVLFDLQPVRRPLVELLSPEATVSPIGLIERAPGELYLVDANAGIAPGVVGDGALFRVDLAASPPALLPVLDSLSLGRPRALVDPAGGDVLPDGRLVVADANADPLGLGDDGTHKGVYGTGRGALLRVDVQARTVETLLASERFVSPVAVRCVHP